MKNGCVKGKVGERELAKFLRDHGYELARRGQQHAGGTDSPDVVCPGLEEFHLECKRTEQGNLYLWLAQAIKDAGDNKVPVVVHRRNRQEWVAIMRLEDFLNQQLLRSF